MWLMLTFNPIAGARTSAFENIIASIFVVIFGFLFVTVSSRICGLIGTSANPVSGMTIATLMATCAMFLAMGWTAPAYSALAITIGGVVCVAAANAGATSQDLKTGFLIGATPYRQQWALMIGVMVSVFVIGGTLMLMNFGLSEFRPMQRALDIDKVRAEQSQRGAAVRVEKELDDPHPQTYRDKKYILVNALGSREVPDGKYLYDPDTKQIEVQWITGIGSDKAAAPQGRLMATVITGILNQRLPWRLVAMGVFLVIAVELLGIRSLSFAVGSYLGLHTTLAIFCGGVVRWAAERGRKASRRSRRKRGQSGIALRQRPHRCRRRDGTHRHRDQRPRRSGAGHQVDPAGRAGVRAEDRAGPGHLELVRGGDVRAAGVLALPFRAQEAGLAAPAASAMLCAPVHRSFTVLRNHPLRTLVMMPPSRPVARTLPLLSLLFLLTSAMTFAQSGSKPVPKPAPPPDPLVRMNESMDTLTKKVWPSVVQILVSSYGPRAEGMRGRDEPRRRQAAVDRLRVRDRPEGYIMTNAHVVSGARRVQIVLPAGNADGTLATALAGKSTIVPARIVGITTELDLALLKVDDMKLPALPLATYSQVRQGETVFAFGSPVGLAQQPDARAGLGCGAAGRSRFAAHLHPDRRANQSREFRRPARQHPGRSRRRQHVHRVAIRRQRRSWLRGPERDRQNRVPPTETIRSCCGGRKWG